MHKKYILHCCKNQLKSRDLRPKTINRESILESLRHIVLLSIVSCSLFITNRIIVRYVFIDTGVVCFICLKDTDGDGVRRPALRLFTGIMRTYMFGSYFINVFVCVYCTTIVTANNVNMTQENNNYYNNIKSIVNGICKTIFWLVKETLNVLGLTWVLQFTEFVFNLADFSIYKDEQNWHIYFNIYSPTKSLWKGAAARCLKWCRYLYRIFCLQLL